MILAFKLSMPGCNSWNGKWSGEGTTYAIVKSYRKDMSEFLGSYYYCWNDGWTACVDVVELDRSGAAKLRKKSKGFCGYDWMVDSILIRKEILSSSDIAKSVSKEK